MTNELAIALVGQRFMGRAHANAIGQVARFFDPPLRAVKRTVVGRGGRDLARFARRWGFERHTTRWRDVLEDEAVGLVDLVTPNHVHAEHAIAALEAGKHVACEKPLAHTLESARAMRDAARKARRRARTFVWFNYRRCPAVGAAWRLVRDGRIGAVRHVRATYLQDWGGPSAPLAWRFRRRLAGSGAHGDLNAHLIDLARFLTGDEIVEVHGAVAKTWIRERRVPGERAGGKRGRSDVDDALAFLASFRGGAMATFEASRLAPPHQNASTIEIDGEKGSLRFAFEDMNLLWFHDEAEGRGEGGWRRILCTSADHHPYVRAWWPDGHLLGYEHAFTNMLADVLRVLAGGEPELPLPDFDDAFETQRVLEAALVAARERRAVKLREIR